MLSSNRLAALSTRWEAVGAPILGHLRPGLLDTELDDLSAPLPFVLPQELRTWWSWHDGVSSIDVSRSDERNIGPFWPFQPLAECVAQYAEWRALSREFEANGDPVWFKAGWLPLSSEFPLAILVCDCSGGALAPTPILRLTPPEGQQPPAPICKSMDELVERWVIAIDRGLWRCEDSSWKPCPERLPPGWPLNGVA